MTLACGVDLGLSGALAVVDCELRQLTHLWDMPTFEKKRGRGVRTVIDAARLHTYMQTLAAVGVQLFTIEEPGYRQGQKGGGTVGLGAGYVIMGAIACGVRYEMVAPNAWKSTMRLTGPKSYSVRRAQEVFPMHAHWFVGPQGGALDGRADAALICEYGVARFLGIRR